MENTKNNLDNTDKTDNTNDKKNSQNHIKPILIKKNKSSKELNKISNKISESSSMNDNDLSSEGNRKLDDSLSMMPEMPKILIDSVKREKSKDKKDDYDNSLYLIVSTKQKLMQYKYKGAV